MKNLPRLSTLRAAAMGWQRETFPGSVSIDAVIVPADVTFEIPAKDCEWIAVTTGLKGDALKSFVAKLERAVSDARAIREAKRRPSNRDIKRAMLPVCRAILKGRDPEEQLQHLARTYPEVAARIPRGKPEATAHAVAVLMRRRTRAGAPKNVPLGILAEDLPRAMQDAGLGISSHSNGPFVILLGRCREWAGLRCVEEGDQAVAKRLLKKLRVR